MATTGARRSTTSSTAKQQPSSSEIIVKATVSSAPVKKRTALTNITNQRNGSVSLNTGRVPAPQPSKIIPSLKNTVSIKKGASSISGTIPPTTSVKKSIESANKATSLPRSNAVLSKTSTLVPCFNNVSQDQLDTISVSMEESMSSCDSLKSPEFEYMDNIEISPVDSIHHKSSNMLCISEHVKISGSICKRDILSAIESDDKIVDVDDNSNDPQFCATIAFDIYKHLRASEVKKRPATNFMEMVQTDVNASMRSVLIDWLVEVSEEYRLVPETLYLTVNYLDRYLSGNVMDRQRLQLLGVACMMIASKYEEICAPQVEEFCYITDNTYTKEEVLAMESTILSYLKFEMTAPTTKCFLRRFICVAQGVNKSLLLQFECLANYIAELSLLEYSMLCFAPSLIAASSVYLAKFILHPTKRPWNCTLQHYTLYQPSELRDCVLALHGLCCCNGQNSSLPAIREKYSQHKYKFVAKKYCPPSIPHNFFHNLSS